MKKLCVCLLIIVFNGCGSSDENAKTNQDTDTSAAEVSVLNEPMGSRSFQFRYITTLEPSSKKVEVWIPVPQSNEVQIISNIELDNDGVSCSLQTEGRHGNKYYYCAEDKGLDRERTLTLVCDVVRKEHSAVSYADLDSKLYGKGTNNQYVMEGPLFNEIIADNNLTASDMKGVYSYVLNGMHYGKPKDNTDSDQYYSGTNPKTGERWLSNDGAYGIYDYSLDEVVDFYKTSLNDDNRYTFGNGNSKYACQVGVGNCTDYHSYFMSLSRTMGVPARFHMGFSVPNKADEGPIGGYHCWADYYIDGEGWYPVDISNADKDPSMREYFFGKVCNDRVEFTTGRDLELVNYGEEVNFFIYPLVKGTKLAGKSFSYKNL